MALVLTLLIRYSYLFLLSLFMSIMTSQFALGAFSFLKDVFSALFLHMNYYVPVTYILNSRAVFVHLLSHISHKNYTIFPRSFIFYNMYHGIMNMHINYYIL